MSVKASSWAWDQPVPGTQKLVLLALADYVGRENHSAWPAVSTLADRCGLGKRTVERSLTALADANLIEIVPRPNKSNLYHLVGLTRQIDAPGASERRPRQIDAPRQSDAPVASERRTGSVRATHEPYRNRIGTVHIPEEQVEEIYNAYPRKVNRPAALAAIGKALKREAAKKDLGMTPNALLEKTRLWATACQQRIAAEPDAAKYVKHPATWFNQQCYLEPATEWGIKPKAKTLEAKLNDEVICAGERELAETRKLIESL